MSRPAEFLTDPRFFDISEGRETQHLDLESDLFAYSAVLGSELVVRAPFRFEESIPRPLIGMAPAFGVTKRGACIHDALYKFGGYYKPGIGRPDTFIPVTRAQADAVYHEMILAKGIEQLPPRDQWSTWEHVRWLNLRATAKTRYWAVRLGGFRAWNQRHHRL